MQEQHSAAGRGVAAHGAQVRPELAVHRLDVLLEALGVRVGLVADGAALLHVPARHVVRGLLVHVDGRVIPQLRRLLEALGAAAAAVRTLLAVDPHVDLQLDGRGRFVAAAHGAREHVHVHFVGAP